MQLLEKEQLQLRKDQEVEHAQLRKGKEALVKGHLAETEALRAELQEAAKQKDKALREQAERSAGELRTTEQLTLTLTLNLTSPSAFWWARRPTRRAIERMSTHPVVSGRW